MTTRQFFNDVLPRTKLGAGRAKNVRTLLKRLGLISSGKMEPVEVAWFILSMCMVTKRGFSDMQSVIKTHADFFMEEQARGNANSLNTLAAILTDKGLADEIAVLFIERNTLIMSAIRTNGENRLVSNVSAFPAPDRPIFMAISGDDIRLIYNMIHHFETSLN